MLELLRTHNKLVGGVDLSDFGGMRTPTILGLVSLHCSTNFPLQRAKYRQSEIAIAIEQLLQRKLS
ncbi:hypothetical protein HAX54_043463, partial [Datura stramonium]|nr:hypothetical protein [Datura stramonium]